MPEIKIMFVVNASAARKNAEAFTTNADLKCRMPHIVIEGPVSVKQFYHQFETISQRQDDTIFKVKDVFINQEKNRALLESLVVEDRISHVFYMVLTQHEPERVTIRLDPLTSPEKTAGVKRLIALIGHKLKSQHPDCRYGSHNLEGYLFA